MPEMVWRIFTMFGFLEIKFENISIIMRNNLGLSGSEAAPRDSLSRSLGYKQVAKHVG
jgi:hypothetical protein